MGTGCSVWFLETDLKIKKKDNIYIFLRGGTPADIYSFLIYIIYSLHKVNAYQILKNRIEESNKSIKQINS